MSIINRAQVINSWRFLLLISHFKRFFIITILSLVIVSGILFIISNNQTHSSSSIHSKSLNDQNHLQPDNCQEINYDFVSFCSCKADRRGLNQNVIAYSLYGNFSDPQHFTRYVDPFIILLTNITQAYPGIF